MFRSIVQKLSREFAKERLNDAASAGGLRLAERQGDREF
jgi:hypothetical protein